MLDKSKLEYLNKEGRYDEICLIFNNEYESLLKNFFDRNNIEYIKNAPISYYAGLLKQHYGDEYKDVFNILINSFSSANEDSYEEVYGAITSYNYVAQRLK